MEILEPSYIVGMNVLWFNPYGNILAFSQKLYTELSHDSDSTLRNILKQIHLHLIS